MVLLLLEIAERLQNDEQMAKLAREHGISKSTIMTIRDGKNYEDVDAQHAPCSAHPEQGACNVFLFKLHNPKIFRAVEVGLR